MVSRGHLACISAWQLLRNAGFLWLIPSVSSDSGYFIVTAAPLKAPTATEVADYRLESVG